MARHGHVLRGIKSQTRRDPRIDTSCFNNFCNLLTNRKHHKRRVEVAARNRIEGETISAYWSGINKEVKPRDMIYALRKLDHNDGDLGDRYVKSSPEMAELARNYHSDLQNQGSELDAELREECTSKVLGALKTKLTDDQMESLGELITQEQVEIALQKGQNQKSAGLDGVTYELWKRIHMKCKENEQQREKQPEYTPENDKIQPKFNLIKMLTDVFNDIELYGVDESTGFSDGWMCPLYKKNDRNEIANYRPLTMLNTNYKILTKVLAMKLANIAPKLLHVSQAGFVPGRKITDQTKLIEAMIEYAEATEQNGLIIALDQEKAYDKIAHDYLWEMLRAFNIHENFISTVKALYEHAQTRVMVNGHLSTTFKIHRGVRQGDPMSCLLFDLAIEPLAARMRESNLRGYELPGSTEKLIANLFADDTTTFLSQHDNFEDLQEILTEWCNASTARFNIQKTEIIPIGTQDYRNKVIETRKVNDQSNPIPANLHIAKGREAVRILGAWIGNKVDVVDIWAPVIEKIDKVLDRWDKSQPTMEGRRLIIQMVIGGMTQYLTTVQGMPAEVEKRIVKRVRRFFWNEKRLIPSTNK